jgi:hypothetical protein
MITVLASDAPTSSIAGVITAAATVITALGGLLLAFAVLLPILRNTKATAKQVGAVHTIVNQQRTDAQRYQIALTELLRKHGIEIPIDQSLPVTGVPDAEPGQPT